jgi:hypothetical protein
VVISGKIKVSKLVRLKTVKLNAIEKRFIIKQLSHFGFTNTDVVLEDRPQYLL